MTNADGNADSPEYASSPDSSRNADIFSQGTEINGMLTLKNLLQYVLP
jgi:hypothetical protein